MKPKQHLGPAPAIAAREEFDLALTWIGWCRASLAQVQATLRLAIDQLRQQTAKQAHVKVGGTTLAIDEYQSRLEAAALEYAQQHRDELFAARQSYRVGEVEIAWRKSAETLVPLDAETSDADLVAAIVEQLDLQPELARLFADYQIAPWLKLEIRLDRSGILKALRSGQITTEELHAVGLTVERPDPKWAIT